MKNFKLNNGIEIPALGLGVYQASVEQTSDAVAHALASGYRQIDTAAIYFNEAGVGEGIRRSGVPREDIFIESKVWLSDYGYEETLHAFEKSAKKLGVDYIDLFILHSPVTPSFERTIQSYQALETLLADGKVRAIGVSNFSAQDLEKLIDATEIVPAVNQVELHPYFQEADLKEIHEKYQILTQCWSPIGGLTFYDGMFKTSLPSTLENETISKIAEAHGKTPAQIMLCWHIQEDRQVIPKSVTPSRIEENIDIFDFELTAEELAAIDALDTGVRGGPDPQKVDFDTFKATIPDA